MDQGALFPIKVLPPIFPIVNVANIDYSCMQIFATAASNRSTAVKVTAVSTVVEVTALFTNMQIQLPLTAVLIFSASAGASDSDTLCIRVFDTLSDSDTCQEHHLAVRMAHPPTSPY